MLFISVFSPLIVATVIYIGKGHVSQLCLRSIDLM